MKPAASPVEEMKPVNGKRKELSEALRKEADERAKTCLAKIEAVLQELNCELVASAVTQYDEHGIGHTFARPFVRPKT